jgi:hypothetical protein
MTTSSKQDLDLGAEQHDPTMRRLLGDLERACATATLSPRRRAAMCHC